MELAKASDLKQEVLSKPLRRSRQISTSRSLQQAEDVETKTRTSMGFGHLLRSECSISLFSKKGNQ